MLQPTYLLSYTECYIFTVMYSVLYLGFLHSLSPVIVSAWKQQIAELFIFTCQCLFAPQFTSNNL